MDNDIRVLEAKRAGEIKKAGELESIVFAIQSSRDKICELNRFTSDKTDYLFGSIVPTDEEKEMKSADGMIHKINQELNNLKFSIDILSENINRMQSL